MRPYTPPALTRYGTVADLTRYDDLEGIDPMHGPIAGCTYFSLTKTGPFSGTMTPYRMACFSQDIVINGGIHGSDFHY